MKVVVVNGRAHAIYPNNVLDEDLISAMGNTECNIYKIPSSIDVFAEHGNISKRKNKLSDDIQISMTANEPMTNLEIKKIAIKTIK